MSPEHFNHPLEIVGLKATQASSEPSEKKTSSSRESSLEINSMFEPKPSHSTVALLLAISQQGFGHRLSFCTLSDSDVLVMPFSSTESSPECQSPQTSDRLRGSEAGVKVPHNLSGYMKIMYARIAVYRIR